MSRALIAFTLWFAFAFTMWGADYSASVCRIEVAGHYQGQQSTDMGSGIIVEEQGYQFVLTNQHVVADRTSDSSVTVRWPSSQLSRPATVLMTDRHNDIAVIGMSEIVPRVTPITLSDAKGEGQGTVYGFGDRQNIFAGSDVSYRTVHSYSEDGRPRNHYRLSSPVRSGDSGGPIVSRHGRLIGLVWGSDDKTSLAVPITPIRSLLDRTLQFLERVAHPRQCPGGRCPIQQPQHRQPQQGGQYGGQYGGMRPIQQAPPSQQPVQREPRPTPAPPQDHSILAGTDVWQSATDERIEQLEQQLEQLVDATGKIADSQAKDRTTLQASIAMLTNKVNAASANDPRVGNLLAQYDSLQVSIAQAGTRELRMYDEDGNMTINETYLPGEPIELRGVYRSRK